MNSSRPARVGNSHLFVRTCPRALTVDHAGISIEMLRRLHTATATTSSGGQSTPAVVLSGSTMVQAVLGVDWKSSDLDLFATAEAAPAGDWRSPAIGPGVTRSLLSHCVPRIALFGASNANCVCLPIANSACFPNCSALVAGEGGGILAQWFPRRLSPLWQR